MEKECINDQKWQQCKYYQCQFGVNSEKNKKCAQKTCKGNKQEFRPMMAGFRQI
jgi:hypothetical protein